MATPHAFFVYSILIQPASTLHLQKIFESLINSFIETKVGIAEDFLSPSMSSNLTINLESLFQDDKLRLAGTGSDSLNHNSLFRSDYIHWLDRKNENEFENSFFDLVDEFIVYLNESCYAGIRDYEFHYTLYPVGSFYKRHLDQFRNDNRRKFSMIMYLNIGWKKVDGGELRIFHRDHQQDISPTDGKIVFFDSSELEHEVLVTNKARMSITGWLKT